MESTDQIINNPEAPLTQGLRKSVGWIMIVGIIFVATNLRAPLTSVGPLAGLIRDSLHISNTLAGLITTLPLLAFALFSPFVPRLGRRWGMERMILISVTFLTLGIMIRWLPGAPALYAGTAVLGLAISVCNVLLPAFIKREFPTKIGLMTGVYSISMNLFGAIASGISVPVAVRLGLGWPTSLGIWGVLSLASIMVWFPQLKRRGIPAGAAPLQADNQDVSLWRSPLAWQVTLFMGLQSTVFYVLIAWLPEILKLQGVSSDQSGWLLSIMQLSLLPFTFVVPVLAGRMSSQRPLVIIMSILLLMGTLGLVYGSSNLIVLWIILLGIGGGFAFSLAMMFFGLRTRNAHQAAELSGMAQSFGYLLAAAGPTIFGYLHDATQSWKIPLLILVGASVLLLIVGLGASRDRYIDSGK
ncbi:MFS transporter [Paenibacillus sp. J22TS3]|uniref:CynX/NimT family MFS transporter n=1 Tax=Paenibacillus sp. J22TS3 TaxID=2807192 RepID=UPI001B26E48A|nr:MFS transporter [Paenibacillus sp. J22TS3]GIP24300.1 ABC transporter permease [Paenibacillus sp. J22TS3]